jgi:hypothetical protein
MNTAEIYTLLAAGQASPTGPEDSSIYTGQIVTWDDLTGVNSVFVNGVTIPNLRVIQSGLGLAYQPGDVVKIQRIMTQYYIIGKIGAPGAGAAQQIVSAQVDAYELTASTAWVDLATPGPAVSAYVGSSRRCLVLLTATISAAGGSTPVYQGGSTSFAVSGASSIPADMSRAATVKQYVTSTVGVGFTQTHSMTKLLTASDGIAQGFNVFTSKYTMEPGATVSVGFRYRNITVIPL